MVAFFLFLRETNKTLRTISNEVYFSPAKNFTTFVL